MTNEEMERAIQFLVEQHAQLFASQQQLTADVQKLTVDVQKLTVDVQKLTVDMQKMAEIQMKLMEATIANTAQIGRLVEAQAQTDIKFKEMAQAQANLAERLDAFIVVVERYISGRQSGNGPGES
jgi:hypothetical protein